MRNIFLLTGIVVSLFIQAQDAKMIFTAEKMVFYGLDFSKAKLAVPDAKPAEIKNTYLQLWSNAVMTDNARFNKESSFEKIGISGDPYVVERRNAAINIGDLMGDNATPLSKETISTVINDYKDGLKKEGLGLVILIESFNKKKEEVIAHFVFFDIATRKVLLSKRMSGAAGGPGLTNHWTNGIQKMFQSITNTEFTLWKKEVMRK